MEVLEKTVLSVSTMTLRATISKVLVMCRPFAKAPNG